MKKTREMMSRGKTPGKGRWIEGYYVGETPFVPQGALIATWNFNPDDKKNFGQLVTHLVIPETVGRCSGLPDKNGRAIFEGDIIKVGTYTGNLKSEYGVITYDNKGAGFFVKYSTCEQYFDDEDEIEVIGNIFDNPELLKPTTGEDIGNAAQDTLSPAT